MRLAFVYSVEPTSPSRQSQQPHFRQSSCQNRSRAFNRNRSVIGFWQPEQSFCDCPIWLVAACTALDALTIEGVMAADEAVAEDWTSLTAATDEEDAKMMLTVFLWEPLTGNRRSPGPPKMRRFNVALKCLGMESAINWINNARYYSVAFSFPDRLRYFRVHWTTYIGPAISDTTRLDHYFSGWRKWGTAGDRNWTIKSYISPSVDYFWVVGQKFSLAGGFPNGNSQLGRNSHGRVRKGQKI